ncbi:hypothetical protein [uncultured Lutibacter sp.]|uniref:hypothetical protein n=1 Tax=uncultured Lutibacter sp. TaxID=437739 RepID=UPI00262E97AD|nr:hypothetical protein [uncultured Lutibacter sp.]
MKKTKHIIELAKGNLSSDGYNYIVSLVKYYLNKFSWPKTILEENINNEKYWTEDEVLSFTQQLLIYIIEKGKLKNYLKIPENYIEYYFKTILVSYVANKIKEHQNKIGLSFDDTKRISLEILNDEYFSKKVKSDIFWNKENEFTNLIVDSDIINDIVATLPKIPITEKTKHYKPRVKTALNDLFNLINRPIKQSIIFNQVFKLFDQSSFVLNDDENIAGEIREEIVFQAIEQIISSIDKLDTIIFLDYFFRESKISLNALSEKYNLPKSTVHYKTTQFAKIISKIFIPINESEGVFFLENLHKRLDELK